MTLLNNRLQEILPLFPAADHGKLEEVYRKIPGTLLQFIDPIPMTKKVECREQNLQVDLSIFLTDSTILVQNESLNEIHLQDPQDLNKYRQPLKMFLANSISQRFHEQQITEVPPEVIAEGIVTHCFAQSPDWGRYRCQQPSIIVRFDSNCTNTETARPTNINVYIYAFLQFQYKESLFSLKSGQEPRISFEVTIELNGVAIDAKKRTETSDLLHSGGCLEEVISDNLNKKSEVKSGKLSWDDL